MCLLFSSGNIPPEMLESETDVLNAKIQSMERGYMEEKSQLLKEIQEIKTGSENNLKKLAELEARLQGQ